MNFLRLLAMPSAVLSVLLLTVIGCEQSQDGTIGTAPPATTDVHDHPSEGPHHGGLIELGNEEYHAELVHDDAAGTVTIYILDSSAKTAVPIEASELLINLSHDGEAEQFKLAATPDVRDPLGQSSRFTSTNAELAEDLDHEGAEAQIVVTIMGKQFRGKISHDHDGDDHEGHGH